MYSIVASSNVNYDDWANLSHLLADSYQLTAFSLSGASFGTKFEGLKVSMGLPKEIAGPFRTGSVEIIMWGWLGAANYRVIVANDVDRFLSAGAFSEVAFLE
jgi:hypothetical protein